MTRSCIGLRIAERGFDFRPLYANERVALNCADIVVFAVGLVVHSDRSFGFWRASSSASSTEDVGMGEHRVLIKSVVGYGKASCFRV